MDPKQKANSKAKQTIKSQIQNQNVLESLKEIGDTASQSLKEDLFKGISKDLGNQLFGRLTPQRLSAEISPGQSVDVGEIASGDHEKQKKLEAQLALERKLRKEEQALTEKKSNELKLQLKALIEEVQTLAGSTNDLSEEVQIAAMQAPVEPGTYHVVFFEKLVEFIKSFRKKVDQASTWLKETNQRASKKNYWSKYKKHGAKFLLSSEHYLTRSAG